MKLGGGGGRGWWWRWLSLVATWTAAQGGMYCEEAHIKCMYRGGCGRALQEYMISCASLGTTDSCPEPCQHALIALTSTPEGKGLMTCECRDESCRQTKERVEVCRPEVLNATLNATVVTCVVAQHICGADTLCSTALKYYHVNCRSMFQGKRCSPRCKNSINILRRQEKAAKLDNCICNGREGYDCTTIRRNMERMCFNKGPNGGQQLPEPPPSTQPPNEPGAASVFSAFVLLLVLPLFVLLR